MLSLLRIANLAVIDQIEVEFDDGLNAITGETGAGKSILLKAIDLILGRRASADVIRAGSDRCEVEALFALSDREIQHLGEFEDELADSLQDRELLIRRVVERGGRSKIYLNGRISTAAIVQRIAAQLVNITGQHQTQTLLDADSHREFLDSYGVSAELRASVREAFTIYRQAKRAYDNFVTESDAKRQYYERLRFEVEELGAAQLRVNEREELEDDLRKLSGVETLGSSINEALELIEGEGSSVSSQLSTLRNLIDEAVAIDKSLEESATVVETSLVQLRDVGLTLSSYLSKIDADPERLEQINERLSELSRLERKYSRKIPELVVYLAAIEEELSLFDSGAFDLEHLEGAMKEARTALDKVEAALTAERKAAAKKLAKLVEQELAELNMEKARFEIEVAPMESSSHGADLVTLKLAANPGSPTLSLSKVASGGELSRVLLVLKSILNQEGGAGLQIFDEIDTGIGGKVAHAVGEKLQRIAQFSQVILVTHAPQIAALAERHYLVTKKSSADRTDTSLKSLGKEERVAEIARMLAGKKVTKGFEDSARELLGISKKRAETADKPQGIQAV